MMIENGSPIRLLIDDTLATAPFVQPYRAGWVEPEPGVAVEIKASARAIDLGATDVALLPAAEVLFCQERYQVVPDVAVVIEGPGAVAMRTPLRPDQVERGPVRLLATNRTTELLARATVYPFYGIEQTRWVTEEDDPAAAEAQVVIVDSAEALRSVEGGYAEDLCRAWFVLTGLPAVSHVLLAPVDADREALRPILVTLAALRVAAEERRREWRRPLADELAVPPDQLYAFLAGLRFVLTADDQRSLLMLVQRGARGGEFPPMVAPRFLGPDAGSG